MAENSSIKFIPQIEPWIDEAELRELEEVIKSTFITENKKTEELEKLFSEYTGAKYTVAYANGTMALFAALHSLGIKEGDEVIVPDLTFVATANAVILAGAKPVFCDVDKDSLGITKEFVEKKLTNKTKAIMPAHLYGNAVLMGEIMDLAKEKGLFVIEDAAQGVGVKLNGKHVGTFGDIGVLSFYGNKTITMGEGGLIMTDSKELAQKCFAFKNHGRPIKGIFTHEEIGYNFSTTDLNAAIGVAQMKKLARIIARKREMRDLYKKLMPKVKFYEYKENIDCVPWFTNIKVEDPQKLAEYLKTNSIGTRRFFPPLHTQPCYKNTDYFSGEYYGSTDAFEHGLSLPSTVTLQDSQIKYIAEKINAYFKN
ncbi:MAG: DegT/DnrJ/EryC1/StrS family aminotransferase [Candidatus Gracilibacteria bacterium]|jgi:perosamine synthetase